MLSYSFVMRNNDATEIENLGGMPLANDGEAIVFAKRVIRDLINNSREQYDGWTVDVAEAERAVGSIPLNVENT